MRSRLRLEASESGGGGGRVMPLSRTHLLSAVHQLEGAVYIELHNALRPPDYDDSSDYDYD